MVGLRDRSLITVRGNYRVVGLRDRSLITGRGAKEWLVLGTDH